VGPNAVLTNALYPLSPGAKETLKGAVLEPGAKVGANCTLLPGVRVGRNSLVGAGSVVTRDVPEDAVVAGNPARVVKSIKQLPYSQG
jgi:acetyltransferase-like isoleucine patch superfamily enzyme